MASQDPNDWQNFQLPNLASLGISSPVLSSSPAYQTGIPSASPASIVPRFDSESSTQNTQWIPPTPVFRQNSSGRNTPVVPQRTTSVASFGSSLTLNADDHNKLNRRHKANINKFKNEKNERRVLFAGLRYFKEDGTRMIKAVEAKGTTIYEEREEALNQRSIFLGDFFSARIVNDNLLSEYELRKSGVNSSPEINGNIAYLNITCDLIYRRGKAVFRSNVLSDALCHTKLPTGKYVACVNLRSEPMILTDGTKVVFEGKEVNKLSSDPIGSSEKFLFAGRRYYKEDGTRMIKLVEPHGKIVYEEKEDILKSKSIELGDFLKAKIDTNNQLSEHAKSDHSANLKVLIDGNVAYITGLLCTLESGNGNSTFSCRLFSNAICNDKLPDGNYFAKFSLRSQPMELSDGTKVLFEAKDATPKKENAPKKFLFAARQYYKSDGTIMIKLVEPHGTIVYEERKEVLQKNSIGLGDFLFAQIGKDKKLSEVVKTQHKSNIPIEVKEKENVAIIKNLHCNLKHRGGKSVFSCKLFSDALCQEQLSEGDYTICISLREEPFTLSDRTKVMFDANTVLKKEAAKPLIGKGFEGQKNETKVYVGVGFERQELVKYHAVVTNYTEKRNNKRNHYLWILDKEAKGMFYSDLELPKGAFFEGTFVAQPDGTYSCKKFEKEIDSLLKGGLDSFERIWLQVKVEKYRPAGGKFRLATARAQYIGEIWEGESEALKLSERSEGKTVKIQQRGLGDQANKEYVWQIIEFV